MANILFSGSLSEDSTVNQPTKQASDSEYMVLLFYWKRQTTALLFLLHDQKELFHVEGPLGLLSKLLAEHLTLLDKNSRAVWGRIGTAHPSGNEHLSSVIP